MHDTMHESHACFCTCMNACMQVLRDEYARLDKEYEGVDPIPRPPYWGGYRIKPRLIEFWHDQASRMHDRLQFTRTDESSAWTVKRLSP